MSTAIKIRGINKSYGKLQALKDINLNIEKGEFFGLLGPNGAGKTTTLRSVLGLLPPMSGEIIFKDKKLNGMETHEIAKLGLAYVPEDRRLFPGMTVMHNLLMGGYSLDKEELDKNLEDVFELFPRLKERTDQYAGTMSGGEQQMLAIGRGLMSGPEMIIVDEPSLGLAPQLVEDVFEVFRDLRERGVTILIVEQNVNKTLKNSDRAYVLEQGEINMKGKSSELIKNDHIKQSYLGI